MKMQEIRAIARSRNIKPTGLSFDDLVRTIQKQEGNFDCFGSAKFGQCDQVGCQWRNDCFDVSKD